MTKLKMKPESKEFLEKNLPAALDATSLGEALDLLYSFIDEYGFEPPEYEWYNKLGNRAQDVYDDLYLSNKQ